jgi:hypothetical protein
MLLRVATELISARKINISDAEKRPYLISSFRVLDARVRVRVLRVFCPSLMTGVTRKEVIGIGLRLRVKNLDPAHL